jgi:hypothetical protein
MMGDQFTGNLTNAFRTVTVSRKRALQLIGGAMAVAVPSRVPPAAEARKHRQPPLAVASVVLVDVQPPPGNDITITWFFKGVVVHKESGDRVRLDTSVGLLQTLTTDQVRKELVQVVRERAAAALGSHNVPRDRIAVTLP